MKIDHAWTDGVLVWDDADSLCISVVFTWQLPKVRKYAEAMSHRRVRIGGPAADLMPEALFGLRAEIGGDYPGVLQRFNANATRTSLGCPRECGFCSVPKVAAQQAIRLSGKRIMEFEDWPDLPIISDDNLLFTKPAHLDRVYDRLEKHDWCDFNQGTDARLVTDYHAERIARLKRPIVRLALDSMSYSEAWERALERLIRAGTPKSRIRTYCIMVFGTSPDECWQTCEFVEKHGVKPLPMWFHELNALEHNIVTERQKQLGWNDYERRRLMQWFYHHKRATGESNG